MGRHAWQKHLGSLIVTAIFVGALFLLFRELKHYHIRDIVHGVHAIPTWRIAAALGLTALNYLALMGYDLLALRYLGHEVKLRKIAVASFVSYAASNNFGALLGGTSVRYRMYSTWGLSAVEIVKCLTVLAITFWVGVFGLAGIVFVFAPPHVPSGLPIPITSVRPLGYVLLGLVAAYIGLTAWRRKPLEWRNFQFTLPSPKLAMAQIVIASLDFMIAAGVLFVLLPPSAHIGYVELLGVFMLAVVAVVFTHVPGGLGVFELVILKLVPEADQHALLASLLLFRVVYYLLPLMAAAVTLATHELLLRRHWIVSIRSGIGAATALMAPRLVATLTFAAGTVLLLSGALHTDNHRIMWLEARVPLPLIELSHFAGSLVGLVLLFVAHGLLRRQDSAYWMTVFLLILGMFFTVLKGLEWEETLALLVVLMTLLPLHRHFYRKGTLLNSPLRFEWSLAVAIALASSIWLGMFVFKHVEYRQDMWWQFALNKDAPRFLRASVGSVALALALSVLALLRPARVQPHTSDSETMALVEPIVRCSPATTANLALLGDKRFILSDDNSAFIMYAVRGRSWVAMGDPVGNPRCHADLVWAFRELCDRFDGRPVFYQADQEQLPLYLDVGLELQKLGEEARVSLPNFSLSGGSGKTLRQAHNKIEKHGLHFEVWPIGAATALMADLREVSDAWLAEKKAAEKSFSLGHFDPAYLAHFPIGVVREGDKLMAFANLWTGGDREELSVDLMRYRPDAPAGLMDALFVELMLWGKGEGYRWFNLGMAPLSGIENRPLAPLWNRVGSALFRHGEHFYNFQGLRQYKEKFEPEWSPKYLASTGGLALPRILADVATLISGGLVQLVQK